MPVPDFLPFRGIRYDAARLGAASGDLGSVVAPPYDVVDEQRQRELEHRHRHNSVRLILPRDEGDRERYEVAATTLHEWREQGVLVLDDEPRFYGYEMEYPDEDGRLRRTQGVIGALELGGDAGAQPVLPHERTLAKAKSDRLALLRATRANLDPIWCLSLSTGLATVLADERRHLATCVDDEGVRHRLGAIDDSRSIERVRSIVAGAPLVIADGHHRFETARAYRDERTAGAGDPGAALIMAFVVELAEGALSVRAIHRLLTGLAEADPRSKLTSSFAVVDAGPNTPERVDRLRARMQRQRGLGWVDRAGLALLVPRADVLAAQLAVAEPPIRSADATRFELAVRPTLPPGCEVTYRSDARTVAALVEKGTADAAVLLRSIGVGDIRSAALVGARMPEKTSFFYPKPRTGMVFRSLDGAEAGVT